MRVVRASGLRSDIVCAQSCFRAHSACPSATALPACDSPSSATGCAEWTPARFFKQASGPESSSDECGTLEDDRCIDTGVFQQRYLPSRAGIRLLPPQQPRISCTILTQADWCAVWTAARCELGLLCCQCYGTGRVRDLVTSAVLAVATSFRQLAVPSRVAQRDWRHTTRVCHPPNPGGCPIQDTATSGGTIRESASRRASPHRLILWEDLQDRAGAPVLQ